MAGARGAYFKATNSLAFDQEAQRIRSRYGSRGFDWYVSLLCALINQADGTMDVSDEEGWQYLSGFLAGSTAEEAEGFCGYLAGRGLLDAAMLEAGCLSSPLASEGIAEYDRFARAGRASGAARRRKAASDAANDVQNNVPNSK